MTHILRDLNTYCFNFNVFISYYVNNHHYDILAKFIKHNNRSEVLTTNSKFDILQVSFKIFIEVEGQFLLETNPENDEHYEYDLSMETVNYQPHPNHLNLLKLTLV